MKKFKAWLQKASKTLKVAEIYESQRPCPNSQNEKRRAGGGGPPWGSQSAGRPVGARATACQTPRRNSYCKSSLAEFLDLPRVPPWGLRIPPVGLKKRPPAVLKAIKILIIFWTLFLIDFGSSWGAILGSFSPLLAAKFGQVRSKTRLESLSSSKT